MSAAVNRGIMWADGEIRAIWGERKVQEELDGAVRNKAVFQDISKRLQEQGYSRDWEQCRTKIKSLKKEYRMVKDHNGEWGEGEKHASSTQSLMEFWGIGQHQSLTLCWILGQTAVQRQTTWRVQTLMVTIILTLTYVLDIPI